ncbi:aspartoacylase [Aureococcus anophagefferens]|nr:aspartoacylase [Aureococcus anophagefferens]
MRYVLTFLRLCLLRAVACKRIVVVGGTHGNEYTGVYLVKALLATPALDNVEPFLANTRAIALNRRFCDEDLNRCFSRALDTPRDTVEAASAAEIDAALGPKGSPAAADLVVDLHTTTANMGTTIIVDAWCPFALRCAAYVQARLAGVRILFNDIRDKAASPYLASVGADALQIEDATGRRRATAFRTFDGAEVPYDGSLGDPVYPIFINEAGYYASSGAASASRRAHAPPHEVVAHEEERVVVERRHAEEEVAVVLRLADERGGDHREEGHLLGALLRAAKAGVATQQGDTARGRRKR